MIRLAFLVGFLACSSPVPGEMPPQAPRPEPVQPDPITAPKPAADNPPADAPAQKLPPPSTMPGFVAIDPVPMQTPPGQTPPGQAPGQTPLDGGVPDALPPHDALTPNPGINDAGVSTSDAVATLPMPADGGVVGGR